MGADNESPSSATGDTDPRSDQAQLGLPISEVEAREEAARLRRGQHTEAQVEPSTSESLPGTDLPQAEGPSRPHRSAEPVRQRRPYRSRGVTVGSVPVDWEDADAERHVGITFSALTALYQLEALKGFGPAKPGSADEVRAEAS